MSAKQISDELITIPAAQFARLLQAAVHCEYLMEQKRIDEEKIHRMRKELTRYQTICENRKKASGAGASEEPQATTDRLVAAERCIEDIEHVLYGVEDYVAAVENVRNLIGVWRKEREAK